MVMTDRALAPTAVAAHPAWDLVAEAEEAARGVVGAAVGGADRR